MRAKHLLIAAPCALICTGVGYILGKKKHKINECGNLRIDNSEEEEPAKIFLEVTDLSALESSEYVILKVVRENYISHKN